MAKTEVSLLRPDEDDSWDELIDASAQGGDFLRSLTLKELSRNERPKASLLRFGLRESRDGPLRAGWAFIVRRRLGLRYSSHFPLFYNGPVFAAPYDVGPEGGARRLQWLHRLSAEVCGRLDVIDCETHPCFQDPRGLLFAGMSVRTVACHLWPPSEEPVWKRYNKTKRNEANRAKRTHRFAWWNDEESGLSHFRRLHDHTLAKFSWNPSSAWRDTLSRQTAATVRMGIGRLFAAMPVDGTGMPEAVVSILLDRTRRTAYLWRVGFDNEQTGLIAALYGNAAEAIRGEFGGGWTVNFGGSPRYSLSLFKDYLGAEAVFHHSVTWQRPGIPRFLWNGFFGAKELRLRLKRSFRPK